MGESHPQRNKAGIEQIALGRRREVAQKQTQEGRHGEKVGQKRGRARERDRRRHRGAGHGRRGWQPLRRARPGREEVMDGAPVSF